MKKFIAAIMFLAILVLPLSVSAESSCYRYYDNLLDTTFVTTVSGTEFTLTFGGSVIGPCPCGFAELSYDTGNGIEVMYFEYNTDTNYVIVAGIEFMLIDGSLINIPVDALVFETVVELN